MCNKGEGQAFTCSCKSTEDYRLIDGKTCEKSKFTVLVMISYLIKYVAELVSQLRTQDEI